MSQEEECVNSAMLTSNIHYPCR